MEKNALAQTINMEELKNCNFIKTVLMLLIVFYHSMLFWAGNWFNQAPQIPSPIIGYIAKWLGSFHIYAFTLISGYIFYFQKYENKNYQYFPSFLINKTKRLLIPYAFISIVWVIPFSIYYYKFDFSDVINRYILAESPSQLWFLIMLFNVFIIFFLLSNFMKNKPILGLVIIVFLYGAGLVWGKFLPNIFQINTSLQYLLFFWMGFKIRQYGSGFLRKIPAFIYIIADIALFIGIQHLPEVNTSFFKLIRISLLLLLNIIGALMAFTVLGKIAEKCQYDTPIFRFLKRNSMPIYLFHQQIIYIIINLINGLINPYLHVIFNFCLSLAASSFISWLFLKTKTTRFLLGEK